MPFNVRPLRIPEGIIDNDDLNPGPDSIIDLGLEEIVYPDEFARVLGSEEETNAQINKEDSLNSIFNLYLLEEKIIVLFFNDNNGIRMAFSKDYGLNWVLTLVFLAREGNSACYKDGFGLCYITTQGIICKPFNKDLMRSLIAFGTGEIPDCLELVQQKFDELPTYFVDQQPIEEHKMAFMDDLNDPRTKTKLIYYFGGALQSKISVDGTEWFLTPNF